MSDSERQKYPPDAPANGPSCWKCGCCDFRVRNTIPLPDGRIKRYRLCRNCGKVITTYEGAPKP
jgi:transcriptional regulator NrdR family protein